MIATISPLLNDVVVNNLELYYYYSPIYCCNFYYIILSVGSRFVTPYFRVTDILVNDKMTSWNL